MLCMALGFAGCKDDDIQFFDGHYDSMSDTTIYASGTSSQAAVTLHHIDRLEEYSLSTTPTQLLGKWLWLGIGSGSQYKPVYSWRGGSYHAITFEQGGIYWMRNGANRVDGTYKIKSHGNTLSIDPGMNTMVGTFSVTQNIHDDFFIKSLYGARAYDIDSEGLLRIYYTRTDCLVLVSAAAVPAAETCSPEVDGLFGEWEMAGVAYGNGIFKDSFQGGMVVFNNDYTAIATGGCCLLTSSLARSPLYYLYEFGSLSIGDRLYHVTIEGDLLYLCGGLDLCSPTFVLRRVAGSGQKASNRIQRDGYCIELYLTNSEGQRTDQFPYGENVVFNINIINECDTVLSLNNMFYLFHNHSMPEMIYGTHLERRTLRSNTFSGGSMDISEPTLIQPHSSRHWQCTLYPTKTIETTPPLGYATHTAYFPGGSYYIEYFLMPEGDMAFKLRHDFTITGMPPKEKPCERL